MLKLIYLLSPVQLHALVWTKCVRIGCHCLMCYHHASEFKMYISHCFLNCQTIIQSLHLLVQWEAIRTLITPQSINITKHTIPILLSRLPPNTTWISVIQTIASHGSTLIWLKPLDQATHCFNRNFNCYIADIMMSHLILNIDLLCLLL